MNMQANEFVFTGIVYKENERYSSLCPELDIASEGDTPDEAATNLLEAVTLYLETAIEANLPYLRPIPPNEDPRLTNPESIAKTFNLKVDFQIKAYA
ncbi:MAG: type II toxin-antitoxin system HicB family antitoxin [Nitrospirae bacterium]|nr:type II toxin-antitoxin system HicB family antitoxin [Nitrospirota bacterium]